MLLISARVLITLVNAEHLQEHAPIAKQFLCSWFSTTRGTDAACLSHEVRVVAVVPVTVAGEVRRRFDSTVASMWPANVQQLWHGTSSIKCISATCGARDCALCSICARGFDPTAARSFGSSYELFGHCAYFAKDSVLSHNYNGGSERICGPGRRAMILSRVAVGNNLKYVGYGKDGLPHRSSVTPLEGTGFDSLSCSYRCNGNSDDHYMIRDGSQALPEYVVVYEYPTRLAEQLPFDYMGCTVGGLLPTLAMCDFHGMRHLSPSTFSCDTYYQNCVGQVCSPP